MKHRRILWIAPVVAGLLVLTAAGGRVSARPQPQGGCAPPCWGELVCQPVGPSGFKCQEHCHCPGGETPGATAVGTPFVVTPRPSPTPFPAYSADVCLSDECPPGETRYSLIHYRCEGTSGYCWPTDVQYLEGCCGPHCPCEEPTEDRQPCIPGVETACSEWGAFVEAGLPVWHANREPYPRALVTLAEEVWVSDAAGNPAFALPGVEVWGDPVDPGGDDCACRADGSCDDDPPPEGTICAYRLGLQADPGNEPPTWRFEDCGAQVGWAAWCVWNRSSWGKPELGVGMDCEPLPAYTVRATVPYWWSFARQWEQWEVVGTEWSDCFCRGSEPVGIPHQSCGADKCGDCDGWCGKIGAEEHGWRHHGPDWLLLDLTDYGWPTPYVLNPNVQLVPHPPCEPSPPVGAIYVPCIEVQAPIERRP